MKLTRDRLKQIIKEELEEMVGQSPPQVPQAQSGQQQVAGKARVHYHHINMAAENDKVPGLKNDPEYAKLKGYVNKQGGPDELDYLIFSDGSGKIGEVNFSKNLVNSLKLAGIFAGNM